MCGGSLPSLVDAVKWNTLWLKLSGGIMSNGWDDVWWDIIEWDNAW